jgi:transaldolase
MGVEITIKDSMQAIKNVKIFADGADKKSLLELAKKEWVAGFTTNPTLMKKAGIQDYKAFALDILTEIKDRPISFEVFSDEFPEMKRQALDIASWADNVNVKIPITNTKGESSIPLIQELSQAGVKTNVTAIFTLKQVEETAAAVKGGAPSIVSVFAGRVADTGVNPVPLMERSVGICYSYDPNIQVLWASPRELYNIVEADRTGCHIITVSHDILAKISLLGKDLTEFSLETVQMFYNDAQKAGYKL